MLGLLEVLVAAAPFLVIGGLLRQARRAEERRARAVERQIALTDAIHRELGAVAAPEVARGQRGGWVVRVGVPLGHGALVAAVTRIAHEVLGREGAAPLEIVLSDREARVCRAADRAAGALSRAAREPLGRRRLHAA